MGSEKSSDPSGARGRGDDAAVPVAAMSRAAQSVGAGGPLMPDPPTILAVKSGDARSLRLLLATGAAPDAIDFRGATATMWAASRGERDCLAALIKAGADVDACDWDGMTPAMWAARHGFGKPNCLDMLIAAGADLRRADSMRRTAATHAKIAKYPAMENLIRARLAALKEAASLARSARRGGDAERPSRRI